jgi:thiol-disulfide isomerase/thioredoxin
MLKKLIDQLGTLLAIIVIGYLINHFFLSSEISPQEGSGNYSQYATDGFFASTLPNEKNINQPLSQYKGKVIVANFWATWCPPCREEMPELSEFQNEMRDHNVVVLGIAIDEMALVKAFNDNEPVDYPLLVAEDEGMQLSSQLGNSKGVLPYTVIIDQQGHVVKTYFGRITKNLLLKDVKAYLPKQ